jgi:hypothetical protein
MAPVEPSRLKHSQLLSEPPVALKGCVTRFFTSVFFIEQLHLRPDKQPKIFSSFVSNSPSYSNLKFDSPLYNIEGSH